MDPGSEEVSLGAARRLAQERRWSDLAKLSCAAPADAADLAPELAYLFADALRRVGRGAEASEYAGRAELSVVRTGDRRLILRTINLLGMLAFEAGRLPSAHEAFDRLLERASEWGDDEFVARASNNLGVLANVRGERDRAMTSYQRAMAAYHRLGYLRGIAQTSYNIGISYRDLGFADDAERHYVQAVRYGELSDSEDVIALAETERAWLRACAGDGALAESMAARALDRHRSIDDPGGAANAMRVLARAAEARRDPILALERLDEAYGIAEECEDPLLGAEIQRDRGRVLFELARFDEARASLLQAAEVFARLGALADARDAAALLETYFPAAIDDPAAE